MNRLTALVPIVWELMRCQTAVVGIALSDRWKMENRERSVKGGHWHEMKTEDRNSNATPWSWTAP